MLEKNKDYVEFTLQYTSVDWARSKDCPEVCLKGYSDYDFPGVPMDVVCKDFNHKVVMISKSDFDQLQTENEQLKKKLEECEKDYIFERDKTEVLEKENKGLEERLKCAQVKDVARSKLLYNHHPWAFRNVPIEDYLVKRGFTCVAAAIDELDATVKSYRDMFDDCEPNYVKCRIDEMKDTIGKWQNVTGYSTPEDYTGGWQQIRRLCEEIHKTYEEKREQEWQKATGCDTPELAKSHIEDLENGIRLLNKNMLKELDSEINEWQKATGRTDPEAAKKYIDRLKGRLNKIHGYSVDW